MVTCHNPANAPASRLSEFRYLLSWIATAALPNVAPYQLGYTRILLLKDRCPNPWDSIGTAKNRRNEILIFLRKSLEAKTGKTAENPEKQERTAALTLDII